MPSIEELLKSVFGYDTFLPLQKEIIQNILARRDTLAVMPTGGGKSLCYQLPALLFDGLTVVVSPLISLMKDQVEALTVLGVPAVYVNSSLAVEGYRANLARVRAGKARLLYVSPETLLTEKMRDLLDAVRLDCLVIDEAHCISEWGHDFRPEYRQLAAVRRRFPRAVCLALTATATPRVRQDIQASLKFEAGSEFIHSFNRPNLLLEVVPRRSGSGAARQVIEFIRQFPNQSGIIYCFSRAQVDALSATLLRHGFSARPYHAGLEDSVRSANQDAFIHDQVDIIVATIAFGMGINKSNVRFILHHDLPKSIESYYQEIGRAGRDGLPATCRLLYSPGDIVKQHHFLEGKDGQERRVAEQHLRAMVSYAESQQCRRVPLLAYFNEEYSQPNCGMCDNCRRPGQQQLVDITIPAQKFLSCVHRTGSRFGAEHVVDVLLGSKKKRVLELGHDTLSTFGIGADLSRDAWKHLAGQLLSRGLLQQDAQYSTLSLTPQGYAFLKNRETFMAYPAPAQPEGRANILADGDYDHGLFELLRIQRRALADEQHVPAFVIFSDRALVEMATYFPQSPDSLHSITGVGDRKLEQYGQVFLNLIRGYCQEHHLTERAHLDDAPDSSPPNSSELQVGERTMAVCAAFNTGAEIEDLAEEYGVQQQTILSHLANAALAGLSLRAYNFAGGLTLPEAQIQRALAAFGELGTQFLRPVFDALEGAVNYDDLKRLRLHYLCNRHPETQT